MKLRPLPSEDDLQANREGVRAVCAPFGDDYWLARDDDGPFEIHRAMADSTRTPIAPVVGSSPRNTLKSQPQLDPLGHLWT